jgi:hypothetical protein
MVDHVEHHGTTLFQRMCKLDLEGIVAKQKSGPMSQTAKTAHGSRFATANTPRWRAEELLNVNGTGAGGWMACVHRGVR